MSNSTSNTYRLTNEQLLLVDILNTMYNDNLRHIDSINQTLNSLVDSNNEIRILLSQILLNSNQNSYNNNSRRNYNINRRWENTSNAHNTSNRSRQILINNIPYVVDSVYNLPRNRRNNIVEDQFNQIFNNFWQPVEIYPTQTQIETATRRVRYCDISRPINTSCPISMEDFNDNDMVTVIRHCGHTFHTDHLINWFRSNSRCPVCRYDIRDYNTGSPSEFFNNNSSTSSTILDISNNGVERNNSRTTLVNEIVDSIVPNSIDNLFNINGSMVDISGNYTNLSTDVISTFLFNTLNRSRNTR
jgi:hypothetical protein